MRKHPQHAVEKARAAMSAVDLAQFDHFCRFRPNYAAIRRKLIEIGDRYSGQKALFDVSEGAIQAWYQVNYVRGKQAIAINELALKFQGSDPAQVLEMCSGMAALGASKLFERVGELKSEELDMATLSDVLQSFQSLLREMRSAAIAFHELKHITDKRLLQLDTAYRLAELIMNSVKDLPQETMIREAIAGSLKQIELEVG